MFELLGLTTKLTDRHHLTDERETPRQNTIANGGSVQRIDTPIKALVGLC